MRIVSGKFKGRKFTPPLKKWPTRPTTDFAKEGLFNILTNLVDFENCMMLDLFGGTGNVSYECISRGCSKVTYVERHYPCIQFVKKISSELDIENNIEIVKKDVFRYLNSTTEKFDFIFSDPPYDLRNLPNIIEIIFEKNLLNKNGLFVLEHDRKHDFSENQWFLQQRIYGNVHFSFFKANPQSEA